MTNLITDKQAHKFYLTWRQWRLTPDAMAKSQGVTVSEALSLIKRGSRQEQIKVKQAIWAKMGKGSK